MAGRTHVARHFDRYNIPRYTWGVCNGVTIVPASMGPLRCKLKAQSMKDLPEQRDRMTCTQSYSVTLLIWIQVLNTYPFNSIIFAATTMLRRMSLSKNSFKLSKIEEQYVLLCTKSKFMKFLQKYLSFFLYII